jgi:hypothetical protein
LDAYIADGINNLSFFDVEDLYSGKNSSYATSELHFKQKLKEGCYERYVDVKRCRISKLMPLPLRARNLKGFEVLFEDDMSPESAPKDLQATQSLSVEDDQTKDKQWERRLLDLSMKNTLLNFSPVKSVIHLLSHGADAMLDSLTLSGEMSIMPATLEAAEIAKRKVRFGASAETKGMKELIDLENCSGILRSYTDEKTLSETVARLIRKNKEAYER